MDPETTRTYLLYVGVHYILNWLGRVEQEVISTDERKYELF
jgi:hypothetical protein